MPAPTTIATTDTKLEECHNSAAATSSTGVSQDVPVKMYVDMEKGPAESELA